MAQGSDRLQLIKFWPFCAPGKGVCGGAKIFGSALLQPVRSVCVSPSERFFIKNCFVVAPSKRFSFVGIMGSVTHFFRALGNITHFQNEQKETLPRVVNKFSSAVNGQ